jgi:hypothetical protein
VQIDVVVGQLVPEVLPGRLEASALLHGVSPLADSAVWSRYPLTNRRGSGRNCFLGRYQGEL